MKPKYTTECIMAYMYLHNNAPRAAECIMAYMYLHNDAPRAAPTIRLLKRMRLFVVVATVEIIIYDITMDRNTYFVEYFIAVIVAYH